MNKQNFPSYFLLFIPFISSSQFIEIDLKNLQHNIDKRHEREHFLVAILEVSLSVLHWVMKIPPPFFFLSRPGNCKCKCPGKEGLYYKYNRQKEGQRDWSIVDLAGDEFVEVFRAWSYWSLWVMLRNLDFFFFIEV